MKTKSLFFLLLFSSFLVAPAVVSVLNTSEDVSYFFSMGEEEMADTVEVDSEKQTQQEAQIPEAFVDDYRMVFQNEAHSIWDRLISDTSSPPPEV